MSSGSMAESPVRFLMLSKVENEARWFEFFNCSDVVLAMNEVGSKVINHRKFLDVNLSAYNVSDQKNLAAVDAICRAR